MGKEKLIKTQRRGPEDDRLDSIELGFAYVLSHLKRNNEYIDFQIVYEYDKITADDICDTDNHVNRWMRVRKKYISIKKENQFHRPGPKVDYSKYEDGKVYSGNKNDPLYDNIKQAYRRYRKKIRDFIKRNDSCLTIDLSFDTIEVIKLFLDTYPDPSFFETSDLRAEDWNAELMKKVFGNTEGGNYFWIRTPGGGIIPIYALNYDLDDYSRAIDEYIKEVSWGIIKKTISDKITPFIKIYKLDINHKPAKLDFKKRPKGFLCSWGNYTVSIEGRREKDINNHDTGPIVMNLIAPKYSMFESEYIEEELYDFENALMFTIYPLLLFEEFHFDIYIQDSYDRNLDFYNREMSDFWYRVHQRIKGKEWCGRSIGVSDTDLVLFHEFSEFAYEDESSYLFVLKSSVRNAYIIKKIMRK